jgi:hypothetical protein
MDTVKKDALLDILRVLDGHASTNLKKAEIIERICDIVCNHVKKDGKIGGTYSQNLEDHAAQLQKFLNIKARKAKTLLNNNRTHLINIIKGYTAEECYPVNDLLRNGEIHTDNHGVDMELKCALNLQYKLFNIFNEFQPFSFNKGILCLYRGIVGDYSFAQASSDLAFMSTSTKQQSAFNFGDKIMRFVMVPKFQYKLLPIKYLSGIPEESEILLSPHHRIFFDLGVEHTIHHRGIEKKMRTYLFLPHNVDDTKVAKLKNIVKSELNIK